MAEIPEELLRRSAEARAKREGRDVEEVLAELKGEAPPSQQEDEEAPEAAEEQQREQAPAEPAPQAPASSGALPPGDMPKIPESLLRRTAEIRAKSEGRDFEEVFAEVRSEAGAPPPQAAPEAPAPATEAPAEQAEAPAAETEPAAAEPAAPAAEEEPAPAPQAAPAGDEGPDLETLSEQTGVPAHLLERSFRARAKAEGKEYVPPGSGEAARPSEPAPAPAAAAGGGGAPAAAPAAAPAIPEGVRTQRLLTVVKAGAIQQVKKEPTDKVNVWPHLLAIEFVALMLVTAGLFVFSVFVDAPLLEFANFNSQPNPSKAPWYFLGLQELLSYFDPQVAGVIIPGFGLAGLAIIPYIDRNPSVRPSDRKLAIMIFTFFVMAAGVLTIFGSFFRGPGFNFVFPWVDGVFFDF